MEPLILHINSAARAGSRPGNVHNINFKCALVHSLNFEAGRRRKGSRRDKQTIASLQRTLAITKYTSRLHNAMVPPKSETLDNCWLGILIKH